MLCNTTARETPAHTAVVFVGYFYKIPWYYTNRTAINMELLWTDQTNLVASKAISMEANCQYCVEDEIDPSVRQRLMIFYRNTNHYHRDQELQASQNLVSLSQDAASM